MREQREKEREKTHPIMLKIKILEKILCYQISCFGQRENRQFTSIEFRVRHITHAH